MQRYRSAIVLAIATLSAAAALGAALPAAGAWDPSPMPVQSQKGRPDADRGDRERGRERARDLRQERQDERGGRLSEDARRSLHRDLDKANRELYGRRPQK